MVDATGAQVCGGSQQYLNLHWKHWWFYGCYTSPSPPADTGGGDNGGGGGNNGGGDNNGGGNNNGNSGGGNNGDGGGSSPPVTTTQSPPPVTTQTPPPQTYVETETFNHPVNTFANYHNASGLGQAIAAGQSVEVSCKVFDSTIVSVNPDGYWYRIASSPWNNGYYSPANTFLDGDPPGGPYTHNTDFGVPDC
jgi:hypothetical protein